jgi:anaerobic magnesium-protoporphyrin IX monomethyl ester cyclase
MADVVLIYPYFYRQAKDKSIFKFPPLGLGYLASSLIDQHIEVEVIDGTFLDPKTILECVKRSHPTVVGFYVMVTMEYSALELAASVRDFCQLVIAGGPYPSAAPEVFLRRFDLVAIGEGENSLPELVQAVSEKRDPMEVPGFACGNDEAVRHSQPRERIDRLDEISFPARNLFDNSGYQQYWRANYGYTTTSIITSRGCPFKCGFCSKPIFGDKYKERSASNVVDEIEDILRYGYDRIWVADDCFTLNKKRVVKVCDEILARGLRFEWECLSRVDSVEKDILEHMRDAGCVRIFFGLESGNDHVLKLMKKDATTEQGRRAVNLTNEAGMRTGGFFILGYPGETNQTILDTVNFSSALPLNYLSYTVPYPLPGTDLFDVIRHRTNKVRWVSPKRHRLLYRSEFSEFKLKFAMAKGLIQHWIRSRLGRFGPAIEAVFRRATDIIFKLLR